MLSWTVGGSVVCSSQNAGWTGEISGFATCADIADGDDGNGLGYTCTIAGTDMVFFNDGSQDVEDVDECSIDFTASSSASFNGCLGSNNDHSDSGSILDSSDATCVNRDLDDYDLVNDDAGYTCTCATNEPATVVPAGDDGHPGGTNQPIYVCCGAGQTYNGGNNECA